MLLEILLWLLQIPLLVFDVLKVVLNILDIHVFVLVLSKVLQLIDVLHNVHFKSLALLVFNRHAAAVHVLRHLLFNFARSSLVDSATDRTTANNRHTVGIKVLVSLILNIVAEILRWHVVDLFGS